MMKRHQLVGGAAALLIVLLAVSSESEAQRTYKFKTKHYLIETTVSDDYAAEVGELMEILHAGYSKWFKGAPQSKGLSRIIIFKTRDEYRAKGNGPANSGGFFSPSDDKIVSWLEGHEEYLRTRVLAHEGFHQFFYKHVGTSAPWINEGLAELYAYSLIDGTDIRFGLVTTTDIAQLKKVLASPKKLSFKELLTMEHSTWNENLGRDMELGLCEYVQSRFLVHFLYYANEGKYKKYLQSYVNAIQGGKDGNNALNAAFGNKLAEINDAFPKWAAEEVKPVCVEESCSANLFHLAQLYYKFKKADVKFDTLDELKEQAKSNKDVKWNVVPITLDPDGLYGPQHTEEIEKWFICPKSKEGYELFDDPNAPEEGLPLIVCQAHHKKLAVCASFRTKEKKGDRGEGIYPDVRNIQTKTLKDLVKEAKKKKKQE
ncbi:MAG: hypothetical protein AB1696_12825 [Planctomycetota bacterium]